MPRTRLYRHLIAVRLASASGGVCRRRFGWQPSHHPVELIEVAEGGLNDRLEQVSVPLVGAARGVHVEGGKEGLHVLTVDGLEDQVLRWLVHLPRGGMEAGQGVVQGEPACRGGW